MHTDSERWACHIFCSHDAVPQVRRAHHKYYVTSDGFITFGPHDSAPSEVPFSTGAGPLTSLAVADQDLTRR